MRSKNFLRVLKAFFVLTLGFVLVACGADGGASNEENAEDTDETLSVISSFSILTDIVEEIGGEHVDVHNLVPIGTDPHEYEPLPEDIKAATDADVMFYNGLNLEGGDNGWFFKLANSVNADEDRIYEAADGVEPMYLKDEEGNEEVNPHAFISPKVGIIMAENVRDALTEELPEYEDYFEENAEEYLEQLNEIEADYAEQLGEIPEDDRVFIASEQAFQYMTNEYDLTEGYIWAIDTEEEGTPEQIQNAVKFVEENEPNVLFVESNVDTRPMETVSDETGVEIYDRPILSDEVGEKGEEGDTYAKYLEYNLDVIVDGLTK